MSGIPNLSGARGALSDMESPLTVAQGLATALMLTAAEIEDSAPFHALGMAISANLQAVEDCYDSAWDHLCGKPLSEEAQQ